MVLKSTNITKEFTTIITTSNIYIISNSIPQRLSNIFLTQQAYSAMLTQDQIPSKTRDSSLKLGNDIVAYYLGGCPLNNSKYSVQDSAKLSK